MSYKKIRTTPDLSVDSPDHLQVLYDKATALSSWQFNVIDEFKSLTKEQIKERLQKTAHPFAVCMEGWTGDFNIGTVIRNANAFNAKEIFYIGDRKFDRRGAVGCYHYSEVKWLPTIDDFLKLKEKYTIVGVDNLPGATSISNYQFKKNSLFVFGEEGCGLTPKMKSFCDEMIYIEQFGSVRSLNCAVASGIIMQNFTASIK